MNTGLAIVLALIAIPRPLTALEDRQRFPSSEVTYAMHQHAEARIKQLEQRIDDPLYSMRPWVKEELCYRLRETKRMKRALNCLTQRQHEKNVEWRYWMPMVRCYLGEEWYLAGVLPVEWMYWSED